MTRYVTRGEEHSIVRLTLEDGRVIVVRLLEVEPARARLGFQCDPAIRIDRADRQQPPPAAGKEK